MPSAFDQLTIDQIALLLAGRSLPALGIALVAPPLAPDEVGDNQRLFDGDHWADGRFWVGPAPAPTDSGAATVLAEIKRALVSQNAVREVVNRHVAGVVGREPDWGLTVARPLRAGKTPTRAEQALIDEAEALLVAWWDRRQVLKSIRQVAAALLIGQRATLRLFVPPGLLDDAGRVPAGDLAQSLDKLHVEALTARQAVTIVHAATQQRAAVYGYADAAGRPCAELSYLDTATGQTVLRVVTAAASTATALPLAGQLLAHEVARDALISPQVRQQQLQLNLAKTMQGRNVVQGGFLERVILNAQMPGSWVDDATAPNGKRFVPDSAFQVGPGRTNFLVGTPIQGADGSIAGYTNPSVSYRDPVPVDTFAATANDAYRAILQEVQQLHALISGDATASGESRKQARADFATSLLATKAEIDGLIRWLIETALAAASLFAGQAGRYAGLRAVADCRLDTGPLSSLEQSEIVKQVDADLLSRETAMSRLGVEDVDAEEQRIAREKAARQATAMAIFGGAGATDPAPTPDPTTDPTGGA